MNRTQQSELFKQFTEMQTQVMFAKSSDYASESDVLSNFKKSGKVLDQTAAQNVLGLIQTKVTRLSELVTKGRNPMNESVADTILDLANYSFLMHCCLTEQQSQEQTAMMEANIIQSTPAIQNHAMALIEKMSDLTGQLRLAQEKLAKERAKNRKKPVKKTARRKR